MTKMRKMMMKMREMTRKMRDDRLLLVHARLEVEMGHIKG